MIYFGGGSTFGGDDFDIVAEFKNLEWFLLGNLAHPKRYHRSIKMGSKIYISGGYGDG